MKANMNINGGGYVKMSAWHQWQWRNVAFNGASVN